MATEKQQKAAKQNIKKAQAKWKSMTPRQHSLAQPEGRKRAKPGSTGEGEFYHIVVRPKEQFTSFRNQDVGKPGGLERVAGKRSSGSWATQAWLVSKKDARMEDEVLVASTRHAKKLFEQLGSKPIHVKGDIFKAKDRPNVPEKDKPTVSQLKAWKENIKKAQTTRRSKKS